MTDAEALRDALTDLETVYRDALRIREREVFQAGIPERATRAHALQTQDPNGRLIFADMLAAIVHGRAALITTDEPDARLYRRNDT
jgi:hypothetical protein